jgi:hypothetical protein
VAPSIEAADAVVRSRLADAKEAAVAGHSTDTPDQPDRGPVDQAGSSPQWPQRRREPKQQRQPNPKTQLEFWAFLIANTGNTVRAIALCIGVSLAIAVPFAILALVFTLLQLQFAVPAAMYAGAVATLSALGVTIRTVLRRRSNGGSGNGGGDDDPPRDTPGDASDDSE